MEQQLFKSFRNKWLAGALIGTTFMASACGGDPENLTTAAGTSALYSGEELFEGILFGQGEAAEALPYTWGPNSKQDALNDVNEDDWADIAQAGAEFLRSRGLDEYADSLLEGDKDAWLAKVEAVDSNEFQATQSELSKAVVGIIDATDPEFFDRFAEEVTSGDHYRVSEILGESVDIWLSILGDSASSSVNEGESGFCILVIVALVVAAAGAVTVAGAVNVAAAVNLAAAANVAVTVTEVSGFGAEGGTTRGEMMIDEITEAFRR